MTVGLRPRVGRASRRIALLGVAALMFALLPGGVAFAGHFEDTTVLDADNATEASVNWSQFTFDAATDAAIGRNDKFPDNLASSVIQGRLDAPLLLTDGDTLSQEVADELDRLGVDNVHVLGGDQAIAETVVDELEALGYNVHREAGVTRIETAIDIARAHAADATEGLLVRAFGDEGGDETRAWADALAAGGWAAEEGIPVFLTQTSELNDNLRAYLEDSNIERITVIGGNSAIDASVVAELEAMGIVVTRVSGPNRFATAIEIAEARGFADAGDATEVILSEGQQADAWAGGFAAAAYSARTGAPIVLSNGPDLPPETVEFLEGAQGTGDVRLVCGPFVEPSACAEAAAILGHQAAPHTNQTLAVTPQDAAENTVATEPSTDDDRQYSVSGLTDGTEYDVVLFPAENVSVDENGVVTFTDAENSNVGDNESDGGGTTGAIIEVINGASYAGGDTAEVTPVNGTITFTVEYDGTASEEIVPVIFVDTEDDGNVELNAANEPTEAFGIGGEKRWVPAEAAVGRIDADAAGAEDEEIVAVDKDADRIVTDEATYFYDSNDVFYVSSTDSIDGVDNADCGTVAAQRTMAQFEAELSAGDELDEETVYNPEPGLQSTFCLEDLAPVTPAATPSEASENSIEIDVTNRPTGAAVTVKIVADGAACTATAVAEETTSTDEDTSEANFQVLVDGLQPSTNYEACTKFTIDGEDSPWDGPDGFTTLDPGATAQPLSTDAYVVEDINGEVSGEDEWRIVFNKQMSPVDANDRIQVADAQGEIVNVFCGGAGGGATNEDSEAICTLNTADVVINGTTFPAGRVLTVQMIPAESYAADNTVAGGDGFVDYPATITGQTGFTDLNGNAWDVQNSPDRVLEEETVTESGTFSGDATGPEVASSSGSVAAQTFTLNFNEAVVQSTLTCGDITVADFDADAAAGPTCDDITFTDADTAVITTSGEAIEAGDTATLAANSVSDFAGNTGPTAPHTTPAAA